MRRTTNRNSSGLRRKVCSKTKTLNVTKIFFRKKDCGNCWNFCVWSSAILFSLIFGQVSAILQQAQKNTAKYHSIIDNMKQFSKLYKLPTDLATRTIDFFMSTWAMNKGIDTDEVCRHLIFVERIDPQEIKLFHDFTPVKLSKLSGAPNNC